MSLAFSPKPPEIHLFLTKHVFAHVILKMSAAQGRDKVNENTNPQLTKSFSQIRKVDLGVELHTLNVAEG